MRDYIIISVKRGNKISAPGKRQLLHGHVVDFDDPDNAKSNYSEFCRSAFLFLKIPRSYVDGIRAGMEGGDKYQRNMQVDLVAIGRHVNLGGISNTKNTGEVLPLFDVGAMSYDKIFKTNRRYDVTDIKATTIGTKTIGTGYDFERWALGYSDLGNLTGYVKFLQMTGTTESSVSEITELLNGYTFECVNDFVHDGNPEAGHATVDNIGAGAGHLFTNTAEGPGTVLIHGLKFVRAQHRNSASSAFYITQINITVGQTTRIYDNLFSGNSMVGSGVLLNEGTVAHEVWNNVILGVPGTAAFWYNEVNVNDLFENNTIINCAVAINNASLAGVYRTFSLVGNTANFTNNANSVTDNCGTDAGSVGGATDNNPQINAVVENEFDSVDVLDGDQFARLKKYSHYSRIGGLFAKNGIAPLISYNVWGNHGNDRPHRGGRYSIGADEYNRRLSCRFGMGRASDVNVELRK